jgi:dATP pyrophosphohydrolase
MRQPLQVTVFPYRMTPSGPEYAIFRRADDGCWQVVAGGVEDGEALAAAALRESMEEAGLAGPMFKLDMVSGVPRTCFAAAANWPEDLYIVAKHHFAMEVGGGELVVLSHEHSEFRWAAFNDAHTSLRYEDDKTALWELDARLHVGDLPRPEI